MLRRPRIFIKRAAVLFNTLKVALTNADPKLTGITTMIVSSGPAAAYALVWEYGNARQTKKGPKTTLGVDPDTGRAVWLTIQAPSGYVRVLRPKFKAIIYARLGQVKFGRADTKDQLIAAWNDIGEEMSDLVKKTAPVDKGDLRGSITWIPPAQVQRITERFQGAKGF